MAFEAIAGKVGPSVYFLCACIAFVFVTVSTPIAQMKGTGYKYIDGEADNSTVSKNTCITFWGYKKDCGGNKYDFRPSQLQCDGALLGNLFRTSEAFAIISIVITLASCVTAAMFLSGSSTRLVTIALALLSVCTIVIPWACMAGAYRGSFCPDEQSGWRKSFRLSAGFGLFVAAWCIQVVGTVSLIAF